MAHGRGPHMVGHLQEHPRSAQQAQGGPSPAAAGGCKNLPAVARAEIIHFIHLIITPHVDCPPLTTPGGTLSQPGQAGRGALAEVPAHRAPPGGTARAQGARAPCAVFIHLPHTPLCSPHPHRY